MWPNLQESKDLVTFTEEIVNGKLCFLGSVLDYIKKILIQKYGIFSPFLSKANLCLANYLEKRELFKLHVALHCTEVINNNILPPLKNKYKARKYLNN